MSLQRKLTSGTIRHETVTRRYKDFVWLHDRLADTCHGFIIPPLPEKSVLGRFDPSFIERRRVGLEKFLQRVAESQYLASSRDADVFITADEDVSDVNVNMHDSEH